MPQKRIKFVLALIFALWAGFFMYLKFDSDYSVFTVGSLYMEIGKSFAEGTGYQDIAVPFKQNNLLVPSGFPLILVPYWLWLKPHIAIYKIFLIIMLIIGTCCCLFWMCYFSDKFTAFYILLAFSATGMYTTFGNELFAEVIFIPILYAALLFEKKKDEKKSEPWMGWLALFLWVFLARIRVVGVPFLVTALVYLVLRKSYVKASIGAALFSVWILTERLLQVEGASVNTYTGSMLESYPIFVYPIETLKNLAGYYIHNTWSFAGSICANMLFPYLYSLHPMNVPKRMIVLGIFLIVCFGAVLLWKKEKSFRFALISFAGVCIPVFSWDNTTMIYRYMAPFFPLLALFFVYPVFFILRKYESKIIRVFVYFLPGIMVVCQVLPAFGKDNDEFGWKDFKAINQYIVESEEKPGAVLSFAHYYTHVKTGIPSCQFRYGDESGFIPCLSCGVVWGIFNIDDNGKPLLTSNQLKFIGPMESPLKTSGRWGLFRVRPLSP